MSESPTPVAPRSAGALTPRRKIAFAMAGVAMGLGAIGLAGECAVRVSRGAVFSFESARQQTYRVLGSSIPAVHDAELGFVPRPGAAGAENYWGTRVTITADGLRATGHRLAAAGPAILAVGDSFTFGESVNDEEAWPAQLEELLGRPVLNAGVFGYGFDQIVLRAEKLLEKQPAAWVIVSIIPDDIRRCEYSYRYAAKPYFEIEAGRLVLRNVPVPKPEDGAGDAIRTALGYSYLADAVFTRFAPGYWLDRGPGTVAVHSKGREIGGLLVERLKSAADRRGVRILFVLQGHPPFEDREWAETALQTAQRLGIATLDLYAALAEYLRENPLEEGQLFRAHMTAKGNRWVAERIAARLRLLAG